MEPENVESFEVPDTPKPGTKEAKDANPTPAKPAPAKYMRRADWGAKPPKWIESLETPVKKVVLTWTETEPCTTEEECIQRVKEIQAEHMKDDKCPDIRHNFLVGGDGALYEGRGYTRLGPSYPKSDKTHEELYGKSIEIAFIQKHVIPLNEKTAEPIRACLGIGADSQFLEESPQFVYVKNGKPLSLDPKEQFNDVDFKVYTDE